MRVLVLGAAAGGGYPQWNCGCAVCALAWAGDPRVRPRTQSSVAVSADGESWFLLNASPDLRQQIAANRVLHPRPGGRHSPIGGAVLTNADVDHVAGLLSLREGQPLTLHATARVLASLRANRVFDVLSEEVVRRRELTPGRAQPLLEAAGRPSGLVVEAVAVPGKPALWLEGGPGSTEDTIGLLVRDAARHATLAYIPACAEVTPELRRSVEGADLLLFDGTLWSDDELIRSGLGRKTGRRMGHVSMSGPDGALEAWRDAAIPRRCFVHVNNTNPALVEGSPEHRAVRAAGWEIAHDGQEFEL